MNAQPRHKIEGTALRADQWDGWIPCDQHNGTKKRLQPNEPGGGGGCGLAPPQPPIEFQSIPTRGVSTTSTTSTDTERPAVTNYANRDSLLVGKERSR
jgi:hypothetical protein